LISLQFLDFKQFPTYSPNGFFNSISPTIPSKPIGKGDKIKNELLGQKLEAVPPTLIFHLFFLDTFIYP